MILGLKLKFPAPANVKVFPPIVMPLNPESVDAELLFVQVWFAPIVTFTLFVVSKVTLPAVAAIVMPPAPMVIILAVVEFDCMLVVPVLLMVIPVMEAAALN
ncbi:hypothetical protein IMCC26134_05010 [Verrucomicrobia bacterium IMCC26134]|nr:hypothetical protein IMCC26134_05010 [Verrucomicrobia bacterium IMCC26134]